jgi:hypothetical protein
LSVSGAAPQTVIDNDGDGILTFNGGIGAFFINFTTGLSKPALGTATSPDLDLLSVDVSGGTGILTIQQTDTDFNSNSSWLAAMRIGGVTTGSVTYTTYFDTTNTPFGPSGSNIGGALGFTPGAFSGTSSGLVLGANPYSLTQVIEIVHTGVGGVTSFNAALTPVPEPNSTLLLGISLLSVLVGYSVQRKIRSVS